MREIIVLILRNVFYRWAPCAKLHRDASPHSLRHTAVSNVVSAAGVVLGRDIAAHSSIAVTNVYAHATDEDRRKARGSLRPS